MTGYRQCPHGYHHPPFTHSCDGCWCEGERDRRDYGWPHDTSPAPHRSCGGCVQCRAKEPS